MASNGRPNKGRSLVRFPKDFTLIDLETTGLSPDKHEIIEIGAIKVRDLEIIEEYSTLIKPEKPVSKRITKINGIDNDMLEDKFSISEHIQEIADFLDGELIVGHNVNFDVNFLYDNFDNHHDEDFTNDFVDTLRLARKHVPELDNHRLGDLVEHFNVASEVAHRAINDCKMTLEIYKKLYFEHASKKVAVKNKQTKQERVSEVEDTTPLTLSFVLDGPRLEIAKGKKIFLIKSQHKADKEEILNAFWDYSQPLWEAIFCSPDLTPSSDLIFQNQKNLNTKLDKWLDKYHNGRNKEDLEVVVASKILEEFSDRFSAHKIRYACQGETRVTQEEAAVILVETFNVMMRPFLITLLVNEKTRNIMKESIDEIESSFFNKYLNYTEKQMRKWAVIHIIDIVHKNLEKTAQKTSWNVLLSID